MVFYKVILYKYALSYFLGGWGVWGCLSHLRLWGFKKENRKTNRQWITIYLTTTAQITYVVQRTIWIFLPAQAVISKIESLWNKIKYTSILPLLLIWLKYVNDIYWKSKSTMKCIYPIRQNQAKYQIHCDKISPPQDFIRRILVLLNNDLTNFFMIVLCKNRAKITRRINADFSVKWRCE